MKKIFKIFLATLVAFSSVFYSCETLGLEELKDPNELSVDQADPDLLLNSVQLGYRNIQRNLSSQAGSLSRINYMFGRNYQNNFDAGSINFVWNTFYTNIASNTNAIIAAQEANSDLDLSYHIAIAKTMRAHVLMQLVDFVIDIPLTEANQPLEFPNPKVDNGQAVYDAALALLSEAKTSLQADLNSGGNSSATDFYYSGNNSKWIKLINTLVMRANLTTGNYTAVINATDVIENTEDDFEFKYGTNINNPDTRHPDYSNNYTNSGANSNLSNWLMDTMVGRFGDFSANTDPRRRYYFYRQTWRTPGSYAIWRDVNGLIGPAGRAYLNSDPDGNGETLSCSLESVPTHFQGTPDEDRWCSLRLGYWGRIHGNDQGAPPDEFKKTTYGVYPAGGKFDGNPDAFPYPGSNLGLAGYIDANYNQQVALSAGGGGKGILPIYLASYVDFMRAEAHHVMNTGQAANFLRSGMTKSIAKVKSFGALDAGADTSQAPSDSTIADFINAKVTEYVNAPRTSPVGSNGYPTTKDQLDILGEQYFVALFGGATDAYNFIRRTGYPRTLARNVEANPGTFPISFLYPSNEISTNPNIDQRPDNSAGPFWYTGAVNPSN